MKNKTILLIEDNDDDVFLMKRALNGAGVCNPLLLLEDGQEAIDYLFGRGRFSDRKTFPLPILVFLDLKLPIVGGHDVLVWIRSQPPLQNLVVIVLSSSNEPQDVEKAYRLGANSYVMKPSASDQLLELARCFKSYWLGFNEFDALKTG
jgi:CheY-like chemotaxis protein